MPQRKVLGLGPWSLGQQGNHTGPPPIPKLARPHGGTFRTWLLTRFRNEALANAVHGHPRLPPRLPFLSLERRQCESLTFSHPLSSKLSTLNWPCWRRGALFLLGDVLFQTILRSWRKDEEVEMTAVALKWLTCNVANVKLKSIH